MVLLFIPWMFIFDSALLGLFSSANIFQIADVAVRVVFAVLAMFLAIISVSSYSWNEFNVHHFCFHNLVPRSSPLTVH